MQPTSGVFERQLLLGIGETTGRSATITRQATPPCALDEHTTSDTSPFATDPLLHIELLSRTNGRSRAAGAITG